MRKVAWFVRRVVGGVILLVAVTSCGSTNQPDEEGVALKLSRDADVSAMELRHRIDDAVPRFIGAIETSADRIREESSDPVVRRRALEWKLEAVEAAQQSAFQADLAAAALDLWLLSVQMDDAFSTGVASSWFGDQQPIARSTAHGLREMVEGYAERIARDANAFERAKAVIHDTAARYPVDAHISRRTSIVTIIGTVEGQSAVGSMGAVRSAADSVQEISNHLNSYMTTVPKLGRWHAELMTDQVMTDLDLASAIAEFRKAASAAEAADALSGDAIDRSLAGTRELIGAERIAMLRDIDRQRIDTLRAISAERLELVKAIALERRAVLEAIRQERIETVASFEKARKEIVDEFATHSFALIDHLVLRVAELAGLVGIFLLVAIAMLVRATRR